MGKIFYQVLRPISNIIIDVAMYKLLLPDLVKYSSSEIGFEITEPIDIFSIGFTSGGFSFVVVIFLN